jgi:hypothetical protein
MAKKKASRHYLNGPQNFALYEWLGKAGNRTGEFGEMAEQATAELGFSVNEYHIKNRLKDMGLSGEAGSNGDTHRVLGLMDQKLNKILQILNTFE